MTWTARSAVAAVVLAAALAASGYAYIRSSLPATSGRLQLPIFGAAVEVIRDRYGVPHIFAQSERDAYAALGFVHAQDRLAQMDIMRRTAEGRLSEVIGAATLPHDRFVRTLGLRAQAEAALAAATRNAAQLLGVDSIGTLARGHVADLLVLSADPLRDIRNTRSIEYVMLRGTLYRADSLRSGW